MSRPRRSNNANVVLQFTSPRCKVDDDQLFLPVESSLQEHEDRWKHMSEQAGEHMQDGSILDLTSRRTSPQTLRVGVPPQVASRVVELHLNMQDYGLPEWLDVVSSLFFQLQHLYTGSVDTADTEGARMRRLYVLYRLPDLLSIDGKQVTQLERQLARPSSPSGHRVKREDWVVMQEDDSNDSQKDENGEHHDEDEMEAMAHGDAVEVSLFGVVKRVNADPPQEEWDEPELQKPYEPPVDVSEQQQLLTVTKSVETAYRSLSKPKSVSPRTVEPIDNARMCGNFKLSSFVGGNPCVNRSRAILDEPHTIDYQSDATAMSSLPTTPKMNRSRSRSLTTPFPLHGPHELPSPERIERPITPDRASLKLTSSDDFVVISFSHTISFQELQRGSAVTS